MYKLLFVCMGNICRSPSAEGLMRLHLGQAGLADAVFIDSAGTHAWHVGSPPDERAIAALGAHGADISSYRARKVEVQDFAEFDLLIAMDNDNLAQLEQLAATLNEPPRARLVRMLDYATGGDGLREVPDPYYGDERDFEAMRVLLDDATRGLLDALCTLLAVRNQHGSASGS